MTERLLTDPRSVIDDSGEIKPADDFAEFVEIPEPPSEYPTDNPGTESIECDKAYIGSATANHVSAPPTVDERRQALAAKGIPPRRVGVILGREFGVQAVHFQSPPAPKVQYADDTLRGRPDYKDARSAAANDY